MHEERNFAKKMSQEEYISDKLWNEILAAKERDEVRDMIMKVQQMKKFQEKPAQKILGSLMEENQVKEMFKIKKKKKDDDDEDED